MLHEIVFSCAGTTRKISDMISNGLNSDVRVCDLLSKDFKGFTLNDPADIVVLAVPVWGGRVPALAVEKLRQIHGSGQRAVVVVVYGNRDYDDALLELCDIAVTQGFKVVSAAAFVAEHCIFPTVAAERPDILDESAIANFILKVKENLKAGSYLDVTKVKGKRPYKKAMGVPLRPTTDKRSCKQCGVCASQCPIGAIDTTTFATDSVKCITCCRCISLCHNDARKFRGLMYKTVRFAFEKMCAKRRDPEWFS